MKALIKYKTLYLMMLPIMAYFLIFSFYPLARGLVISFQNFRLIGNRPFVGFKNYAFALHDHTFWETFQNTLFIGCGVLVLSFVMPIILALSLNEVYATWFKKTTQMIVYIPHLFSWVVVGGMWILLLAPDTGIVNQLMKLLGAEQAIPFMASQRYAPWVIILVSTWKEMGFTCILYLASIVGINPSLYEAARIDGASRWGLIRYVTLPQLATTMKVVVMLSVLGILRMFDQVLVMRNGANAGKVDVIMMYTYQKGLVEFNIGVATAAGFLVILATFLITFVIRKAIRYDEG